MADTMVTYPQAFDFMAMPYQKTKESTGLQPLSYFETPAEFGTDSDHSNSPVSPVFTTPYALTDSEDWFLWDDKAAMSPNVDFFKTEPYDSPRSASQASLSPAINPMELTNPTPEEPIFSQEGISDEQPLFQSSLCPTPAAPSPVNDSPQPQPQIKSSPSSTCPIAGAEPISLRSRSRKRKSPDFDSIPASSPRSSPSPPPQTSHQQPRGKRPSSLSTPPKRNAHNMVEKRYRTNLNDKIAALRDSVPALRATAHKMDGPGSEELDEDADLGPVHKLNKGTILSKATEYIAHLERMNQSLAKENSGLKNRVEGFEMLIMSGGGARGVWQ